MTCDTRILEQQNKTHVQCGLAKILYFRIELIFGQQKYVKGLST